MINELVDDSISSIVSNPVKQKKIVITIEEKPANMGGADYAITVEDSGAGIKDLNACFSFANTSAGESPLNKYGVGFKKVLATLDPENQYWFVETRSEQEYKKGILRRVEAPYRSNGMIAKIVEGEEWKGSLCGAGTLISFPCSATLLASAGKKYPGHSLTTEDYIACICEEIAVSYIPRIKEGISIDVNFISREKKQLIKELELITPNWNPDSDCEENTVTIDFGNGPCRVHYKISCIEDNSSTLRYFKKNIANSGLMVYEDGRLIESNLFSEIWDEAHPKFNAFLAIVEIDPIENADALPPPTPTKDALFYGDERVMNFYRWVRSICPSPYKYIKKNNSVRKKKKERNHIEQTRRDQLVAKLRETYGSEAIIKTEVPLYGCSNYDSSQPRIDIYLYAKKKVGLIECKAETSTAKDVFQLVMYHIGALFSDIKPNYLILVAERHPRSVRLIARYLNKCKDPNGTRFSIHLKTWDEYGIS
jgi:hypothetical protein